MASVAERTVADSPNVLALQLVRARRRWRTRHAIVGAAITLATLLVALWVAAVVLEQVRFTPASIRAARWSVALVTALAAVRWLIWPLLRSVSDARLALYLEERIPSLGGAVLSAVEVDRAHATEETRSPLLMRGLIADAARRLSHAAAVPALERDGMRRGLALIAVLLASAAALFSLGPAYLRQTARLVLLPFSEAAAEPVYAIAVTPGNVVVPRGGDLQISAALQGFTSDVVELSLRRGSTGQWDRIPMGVSNDSVHFIARVFDVADNAEYFVESNGVRSGVFKVTVRDLPAVRRLDVELKFPAYTGLAPEKQEDGGDIVAVKGTNATISVRATRAVRGGRLMVDGVSPLALTRLDDSTLSATVRIRKDGFYRVELTAEDGTVVAGNVDYNIDALEDHAPQVTIRKPGRDIRPSNVEEIFIEGEASDDYGVGRMQLVYSVNGGEKKTISLADGTGRHPKEMTAGHTLFLEELALQPGDVISYYVEAWDADAVSGPKSAASDMYFITIRPFDREYKQNQQAGGGGGGQQQQSPSELIAQQREIIAATFKSNRDKATTPAQQFRENVTTIHLAQGRVREQVIALGNQLQRPAVQAADTGFKVIAQLLPKAVEEMRKAEEQLVGRKLDDALPPEQRALQYLERAEAVFKEVQVSMQNGGGGGGGNASQASDLADLFELETDKMRNQYEQVQRGAQEQASKEVDETLERLKRLASRQQQENERARQRGMPGQQGGSGGGSQRQLAEEAEQLARRLERLAREQNSAEMQQTARSLQEAADQMRKSAANDGKQGSGSGSAALDRIENARRLLEEGKEGGLAKGMEDATERARRLAEQQREVQRDVAKLGEGANREERERKLESQKNAMAGDVKRLEEDLDRMARESRRERAESARRLQEASRSIREGRIEDKIRFSTRTMRGGSPEYAKSLEAQIGEDLDSLRSRIASAANVAASDSSQRASRALAQARDLVRGLSSIDDRMRERQQANGRRGLDPRLGGQGDSLSNKSANSGERAGAQGSLGSQQSGGARGANQKGANGAQNGQSGQSGQGSAGAQSGGARGGQGDQPGQGSGARGERPGQGGGMLPAPSGEMSGSGQGAPSGRFSSEEGRQFSRELRAQREAAEALRRELRKGGGGRTSADLDRLIARLRDLESGRSFDDPEELNRLRGAVLDGFKEFEFALRRQLGEKERDGPVLGGSDDVPAGYRDLVSEYFRSLSRKPKN